MSASRYKWSTDLALGIDEIDKQHANLFDRLNKLINAMTGGGGERDVEMMLKFLENYVVMHFSVEEKFMSDSDYPKFVTHKKEHETLIAALEDFKKTFAKDGVSDKLVKNIEEQVGQWLVTHIGRVDREFGTYLKDNKKTAATGH